jgi:type II secretory pathway component GspD/PulD (secretin)
MKKKKPKSCRTQPIINAILLIPIFLLCGCGGFFDTKPTEMQSQNIIKDLSREPQLPGPQTTLPAVYLSEPKILDDKDGAKLFYFTRFHTVEKYSGLIKEQFNFPVSQNPATNQLIVKCPNRDDAKKVLDFLQQVDVPPIQVKIDCLVSEIYADRTLDWETTMQISNLFGEKISMGGSAKPFGKNVSELVQDQSILPSFPGASMREVARSRMGLKIGYASDNFLAMVDVLESRGYLKVLMHPSLEVINGKKAMISATESVPVSEEVTQNGGGQVYPYMMTKYKDVVDSLEIIPHAFADGSIGLEIKVVIGSKNIPEGVKQIPIISKKEINIEENRIRPGESLVIGGLRKSQEHSVVRGIPLLKDIPLLGVLFSSKDYEEQAKEVMFIVTPTISSGGTPANKMLQQLKNENRIPNISTSPDIPDNPEKKKLVEPFHAK